MLNSFSTILNKYYIRFGFIIPTSLLIVSFFPQHILSRLLKLIFGSCMLAFLISFAKKIINYKKIKNNGGQCLRSDTDKNDNVNKFFNKKRMGRTNFGGGRGIKMNPTPIGPKPR